MKPRELSADKIREYKKFIICWIGDAGALGVKKIIVARLKDSDLLFPYFVVTFGDEEKIFNQIYDDKSGEVYVGEIDVENAKKILGII
jgi:hypothetical protein